MLDLEKESIDEASGVGGAASIQARIFQSLNDPTPVTFQVCKWFMKLVAQFITGQSNEQMLACVFDQGGGLLAFLLLSML